MNTECVILKNLLKNDKYVESVFSHLKEDYFTERSEKELFNLISAHIKNYGNSPSYESLNITLENTLIDNSSYSEIKEKLSEIYEDNEISDVKWLTDLTEKHCKDTSIVNAIQEAVNILGGNSKNKKEAIPSLLSDALGVNFESKIGHDYLEGFEERFKLYKEKTNRYPFHLKMFNTVTNGGLKSGTLNLLAAGTNVGKTIMLCDCAANWMRNGYNVLYITLEEEEKDGISKRIDANLLDVNISEFENIPDEILYKKADKIKSLITGKLKVVSLPETSTTAATIEGLLNEFKQKQGITFDIFVLDYLNLVGSYRLKDMSNGYEYVKRVSEEIRALAKKFDFPCLSAVQFNRKNGQNNSSPNFDDVGESHGISKTCDLMLGLCASDELAALGQVLVTQMKSRYGNKKIKQFNIGLEVDNMRFYDLEEGQFSYNKEQTKQVQIPEERTYKKHYVRNNSKVSQVKF